MSDTVPSVLPEPDRPKPAFGPSRPRDDERDTRKPLGWWDRVKFLLLFGLAWFVLAWSTVAEFKPLITMSEAFRQTLRSGAWVLVLFGLELLRQLHFLISERSRRYHYFWTQRVFARWNGGVPEAEPVEPVPCLPRAEGPVPPDIADLALAATWHTSAFTALFELPAKLVAALPFAFQMLVYIFIILLQFVMLFWFLSRGGSDIIFPEDVTTRFGDIKGQDAVLARVKENVIFLEKPDLIEERGGTVPKGILLWGPPGTGKTMMAKAVAGETSKPFISVEPGAFIQMFVGVGILKVKALFRKARKLSLRYGGVIMFFDEVDSLGNRGGAVSGGGSFAAAGSGAADRGSPWATNPACNGLSYLSPQSHRACSTTACGPAAAYRWGRCVTP